ncbi:MAG TPA: hypothetical protein VMU70_01925 [Candidatus Tyrphobacter sp.]|nr:hypothetical protein [Candidatus Tyrphobacter sp.]
MPQYQNVPSGINARLLEEKIPIGWPWRFLTATVVIFAAALISYLGLKFGYEPYLSGNLKTTNDQVTALGSELSSQENQKNFLNFYSKLNNVQRLLGTHVSSVSGLSFMESLTNPQVILTSLKITVPQDEIDVSGNASSYAVLASQLQAYEDNSEISQVVLGGSQTNGNLVQFNLKLLVKTEVFKDQSGFSPSAVNTNSSTTIPLGK